MNRAESLQNTIAHRVVIAEATGHLNPQIRQVVKLLPPIEQRVRNWEATHDFDRESSFGSQVLGIETAKRHRSELYFGDPVAANAEIRLLRTDGKPADPHIFELIPIATDFPDATLARFIPVLMDVMDRESDLYKVQEQVAVIRRQLRTSTSPAEEISGKFEVFQASQKQAAGLPWGVAYNIVKVNAPEGKYQVHIHLQPEPDLDITTQEDRRRHDKFLTDFAAEYTSKTVREWVNHDLERDPELKDILKRQINPQESYGVQVQDLQSVFAQDPRWKKIEASTIGISDDKGQYVFAPIDVEKPDYYIRFTQGPEFSTHVSFIIAAERQKIAEATYLHEVREKAEILMNTRLLSLKPNVQMDISIDTIFNAIKDEVHASQFSPEFQKKIRGKSIEVYFEVFKEIAPEAAYAILDQWRNAVVEKTQFVYPLVPLVITDFSNDRQLTWIPTYDQEKNVMRFSVRKPIGTFSF